jgi:Cys-tRNA(Pro) deacylase
MPKPDYPITSAIRALRENHIDFKPHQYEYVEKGGTRQTAVELNVDEHCIIKTIVLEDENRQCVIVLMHGDWEISTKELARQTSKKRYETADAPTAQKATGYQFGGTSPLGTLKKLPIYAEKSIFELDKIFINGGKRGFIVEINPHDLLKALDIKMVEVAIKQSGK